MDQEPARLPPRELAGVGRGRGPLQLQPIVLPQPPQPRHHAPEAPAAPEDAAPAGPRPHLARRGAPLQPLLQRLDESDAAPAPWWAPHPEEGDDDDLRSLLTDMERRLPAMLQSDCLPMDHTLPHLLRQVAGTDELESVQSIKLRVVGRETSLQRLCLYIPRLTELNLDGSSVGSLRELGCGLTGLRILRVTRCGLETLDGTFGLSALEELYAGYNTVEDIGYLACLPCIQLIDLRGNRVSDIRYAGFLTVCAFLRELVLADNPCCEQLRYRATIRELLPGLQLLDGVPLGNYQQDDEESDSTPSASERTPDSFPAKTEADVVAAAEEDEEDSSVASTASGTSAGSRGCPPDATQIWTDAEHRAGARPSTATCATPRRGRLPGGPLLSPRIPVSHWVGSGAQRPASASDIGAADAPSPLTSGKAVCGNLTLALRRARCRREAWGGGGGGSGGGSGGGGGGGVQAEGDISASSSSSSSLSDHVSPFHPAPRAASYADGDGVLAASRRWRKAYQLFRETNRQKWEEETSDGAPK